MYVMYVTKYMLNYVEFNENIDILFNMDMYIFKYVSTNLQGQGFSILPFRHERFSVSPKCPSLWESPYEFGQMG